MRRQKHRHSTKADGNIKTEGKEQKTDRAEPQPDDDGLQLQGRKIHVDAKAPEKGSAGTDVSGPSIETQLEQAQDQLLRLRADFENYKKRVLREKTELCEIAAQDVMLELLPVLDHIMLAMKAAEEHDADQAFRDGLRMIFDQLMGVLSKFGLEPIDAEGHAFDLNLHEAINYLSSAEHPEGNVIAQVRRGYLLRKRLIRPAQVIVSSGPAPDTDGTTEETNNS